MQRAMLLQVPPESPAWRTIFEPQEGSVPTDKVHQSKEEKA